VDLLIGALLLLLKLLRLLLLLLEAVSEGAGICLELIEGGDGFLSGADGEVILREAKVVLEGLVLLAKFLDQLLLLFHLPPNALILLSPLRFWRPALDRRKRSSLVLLCTVSIGASQRLGFSLQLCPPGCLTDSLA
jgi:hypothetical protein